MAIDVLSDRYRIESLLSEREGKRTLKAEDLGRGEAVLIREYDLGHSLNRDRLERFKRQAALLKQISHPRIPALLDCIETESQLLLVSKFIVGETLAARRAAGWAPQAKDAVALGEQLVQILSFLQGHNLPRLSFRLRPEKLLIDAFDRIWLADFGGLQPGNELQELAACLIQLLTGRALAQLPRSNGKPAFQHFVAISPEFARWLEDLLAAGPRHSAAQALESLWKLQGKPWQPPLAEARAARLPAPVSTGVGPWPLESQLDGQYRLTELLGQGAGKWKYAARDKQLKQDVRISLQPLPADPAQQPLESFVEPVRSLQHPQIPRFLRAFVTEQAGQPYLALVHSRVSGETLKDKFDAGWRPRSAEIWDLARQLLKLLEYVQTRGQGHGHLAPSNLIVNNFGRVWLIDFGLQPAEPAQDLYDLAASLIYLLAGARPGEFLAGDLQLRCGDGKPCPPPLTAWLRQMLQADGLRTATEALAAFEQARLTAEPPKQKPLIVVAGSRRGAALAWEAGVEQLQALGLQSRLLEGGGIELHCPESKELNQWNRSKTIGLLTNPLRLFDEQQEKSRQKSQTRSKFFPLSGHRLELRPDDIRLCKIGQSSHEYDILALAWAQLLQARLTPAPPRLLEALKNKVMPPAGTNFRLFHLLLSHQAQNSHCLMFLPPKALPPLTQLIRQQLAPG